VVGSTLWRQCAATPGCLHFVWDARETNDENECRLLSSNAGRQPEVGFVSGYTSALRATLENAHPLYHELSLAADGSPRVSNCSTGSNVAASAAAACPSLIATTTNGYTVSFGVSLGAPPLRGAVWLELSVFGTSALSVLPTFTRAATRRSRTTRICRTCYHTQQPLHSPHVNGCARVLRRTGQNGSSSTRTIGTPSRR
jgi:hypothetical protein